MSELLTRKALLVKEKLETVKVDLDNESYVFVRQMTGRERDRFEQSLMIEVEVADGESKMEKSLEDFRAKLAVNTLCDAEGKNLLDPADYPVLSQNMSAARLEKIVNKAQKLNAISEKDQKALVKNSGAGQDAGTTSGSVKS